MQNVHMLVKMDFSRAAAAEALKQTNNSLDAALDVRLEREKFTYTVKPPTVTHPNNDTSHFCLTDFLDTCVS